MKSLSKEEWLKLQKPRNKYNAKRTIINGESFPSRLEADVWAYHKQLEDLDKIQGLTRKATVRFPEIDVTYKADMKYWTVPDGHAIYIEAKGIEDRRWRLIKKLWKVLGGSPLQVWKRKGNGIYLAETILPNGNM